MNDGQLEQEIQQLPNKRTEREVMELGPFMGIVSGLDPDFIPDNAASDLRNCLVEDGRQMPRNGFRNLAAAPSGFVKNYGFQYVAGFDSSGNTLEEYLALEDHGAGILPFSINVTTGVRTAITSGGTTPTPLAIPTYGGTPGFQIFCYNNIAYVVSNSETSTTPNVWQHTVGTNTSWTNLIAPSGPTVAPKAVTYRTQSDSGSGSLMYWDTNTGSGISNLAITVSGSFLTALGSTGNGILQLQHSHSLGNNQESILVDLTATNGPGAQDFTYIDRLIFQVNTDSVALSVNSFEASMVTSGGTTHNATNITVIQPNQLVTNGQFFYFVICDFTAKSPRSAYSSISKIGLSWMQTGWYNSSSSAQAINILPVVLSNVNSVAQDSNGNPVGLNLAYSYYNSTSELESALSPVTLLTPNQLHTSPYVPAFTNFDSNIYYRLKLYLTAGNTTQYDTYNIYASYAGDTSGTWYQVAQVPLHNTTTSGSNVYGGTTYDATYDYQNMWSDVLQDPSEENIGGQPFENFIGGVPFQGSVVWLSKLGQSNVQFSEVGNPTVLFSNANSVQLDTQNIGAPSTLTLADNGADDPLAAFAVNTSLIVLGSKGVYGSSGTGPDSMTPFYRLPTGLGCAGQFACCQWHDSMGNPGVAFVSKGLEGIYLAQQDVIFYNTTHFKITELTMPIRGLLRSFLLQNNNANVPYLRMGIDENRDAMYCICQNRAMVYRRPSLGDQQRHWELYQWNIPGGAYIQNICFTTAYRMRWVRSTGEIDENEWNSSTNSYITGANSDGGNPLSPLPYWTSKTFVDVNRRIDRVRVHRQNLTDTPTVTDTCTRQPTGESHTVLTGDYDMRFGQFCQGEEHQFTIQLQDGSGYVRRVEVEQVFPLGRHPRG